MFTNVEDAIYYIEHIKRLSRRENLDRMKKALSMLNNPEKAFKKIHIAGTNGKGSTSCYLKHILMEMGYNVGAFVSPYVIKFNERIMINDEYISDLDVVNYTNKIKEVCDEIYEKDNDIVTFFEFLTLMGFLYYADKKVDYAIIEVGMGGILDATNVIDAEVRIITNIGFDHMKVLGNTLEEIADKKLGIVHKNDILVTSVNDSLIPYFNEKLKDVTTKVYYIDDSKKDIDINLTGSYFIFEGNKYRTPLIGYYQATNAKLAIETLNILFGQIDKDIIQKGLDKSFWPGRCELVSVNPCVLIDGGHNIHGINALVESLKDIKQDKHIKVIFTALIDKETDKMISKLEEIADSFIFTEIDDIRKKPANMLLDEAHKPAIIIENYVDAIREGLKSTKTNDILLITGSLHFISFVRKYFKI